MSTTLATAPLWDDTSWHGLPTLREPVSADVCVIGLGGSGLTAVLALRAAGHRVIGIDAAAVGGGAAGRNGGFLLAGLADFHHAAVAPLGRARATALYRLTVSEIDRIAAETPQAVRRTGSLRLATTPEEEADCRVHLDALTADALPATPSADPALPGIVIPTDAALQPLQRTRALARHAVAAGVALYEHSPVVGLSGSEVRTTEGRVRCAAVVVAVDGGLERLLPELASPALGQVRTARAQMLATAPTDEVRIPRPTYARWGMDYWQQLPNGCIALGGCRDVGGEAEWGAPARPSAPVQAALERLLRQRLGVRAPVTHRWAGRIAFTADVLPVLAEVRPRVWVAGAYRGTGNVVGALCGRAAAGLAVDDPPTWTPLLTEPTKNPDASRTATDASTVSGPWNPPPSPWSAS